MNILHTLTSSMTIILAGVILFLSYKDEWNMGGLLEYCTSVGIALIEAAAEVATRL